jgi:hypothetical protein
MGAAPGWSNFDQASLRHWEPRRPESVQENALAMPIPPMDFPQALTHASPRGPS